MGLGFGPQCLDPGYFQTHNIVFISYPAGAGGKFLANCLGLSRHAVLQHIDLARQQLNGTLHQQHKFDLLMQRLNQTEPGTWNDLGLGCEQLFGCDFITKNSHPELAAFYPWHSDLEQVIKSQLTLFKMVCWPNDLFWYFRMWPNAKCIWFDNSESFIAWHRPGRQYQYSNIKLAQDVWKEIRQPGWPLGPPATIQNMQLPPFDELPIAKQDFERLQQLLPNQDYFDLKNATDKQVVARATHNRSCIAWDAKWYKTKKDTVDNVGKIYQWLEYDDFNADYVGKFYQLWITKSKDT